MPHNALTDWTLKVLNCHEAELKDGTADAGQSALIVMISSRPAGAVRWSAGPHAGVSLSLSLRHPDAA